MIRPPNPKIDNSGKTHITNSKPSKKKQTNNKKTKPILTTPVKLEPSPQSKTNLKTKMTENIQQLSILVERTLKIKNKIIKKKN